MTRGRAERSGNCLVPFGPRPREGGDAISEERPAEAEEQVLAGVVEHAVGREEYSVAFDQPLREGLRVGMGQPGVGAGATYWGDPVPAGCGIDERGQGGGVGPDEGVGSVEQRGGCLEARDRENLAGGAGGQGGPVPVGAWR